MSVLVGIHLYTFRGKISFLLMRSFPPFFIYVDTLRRFIRPKDFQISPLKERDVLPDDRQIHQLSLTYEFKSPCSGDVSITPRFPKVNNYLYDAVFENAFLIGMSALLYLCLVFLHLRTLTYYFSLHSL